MTSTMHQGSASFDILQNTPELLAAIVETSDDAIISKTLEGIVTSWNAAAERHFGYTAEEVIGRHISFLIPPDRIDEEDLIIARLRSGERVDHFDTIRRRKDGQLIHVSLTISPVRDSSGTIVGASKIARDITQRKVLEDDLRRYAAELSKADRRKNEFLAMLAHELRNPLAPIRNSLGILRATQGESRPLEIMERQVAQLVRLVDDLLDISRITSGKIELRKEPIDLCTAVMTAVEAARPSCEGGGVELQVSLPDKPVILTVDAARLSQSVGNLLNNSCKFTDRGGLISLTLEDAGEAVVIKVRDTGIGIAPDKLSNIFGMFVQADTSLERSTGGLGIGLTLVKTLVEMHGGTVEARSEGLGAGSEFIVVLPKDVPAQIEAIVRKKAAREPDPEKRILVVDDDFDSADSLSVFLSLSGYVVRKAHDGIEAVKIADEFHPHVILLDIGLPRLNGYEAARVIKRRPWGSSVHLIALTGWGQEGDIERSRSAGFESHFIKPVDHDDLLKKLAAI
jgi:PAS domain S-box-containing protein